MTTPARGERLPPARWPRVAARLGAMVALLFVAVSAYYACKPFARRNPVPHAFLGGIARLAGVRVRRAGSRPAGDVFYIANHLSWIDIPAIAATTGSAFVAHDGLASVPLLRWLCRMADTVFVARSDRQTVAGQVEQVREALADTGALTLFPEGTTGPGAPLLPFKSALVSALTPLPEDIAVVPVWLDFGAEAAEIAWVGDEPGLANFLRILARRRRVGVTVHLLEPLTGEALASRKTITAAARASIEAAMERAATGSA